VAGGLARTLPREAARESAITMDGVASGTGRKRGMVPRLRRTIHLGVTDRPAGAAGGREVQDDTPSAAARCRVCCYFASSGMSLAANTVVAEQLNREYVHWAYQLRVAISTTSGATRSPA